jgi:DNA invertase Pin-like site-specific DNA recombinase
MSNKPLVYSYIRFSTPEQAMGRSETRQLEAARDWARGKGLELDESLRLTDRGISSFRGTHRKKGDPGRFLKKVESGEVPAGSILIVENVDRLSREGVLSTLKGVIFALVERGVTLHFLSSGVSFDKEAQNDWRCNYLISELQRAYAESKRKSDLSRDNWKDKRENVRQGRGKLTSQCVEWLRPVCLQDGRRKIIERYEPIPEAAEALCMIFDLRLKGIGWGRIEQKLNAEANWTPPIKKGGGRRKKDGSPAARQQTTGWRISYLKKIIRNRAVIGECQHRVTVDGKRVPAGDPIPDYYPVIVDPAVFHAVQAKLKANQGHGGRVAKVNNLLAHLAKCGYCRGPMAFVDRGKKGDRWLICDNGRRGVRNSDGTPKCCRHSMKYAEVEKLLLDNCLGLKPEQILPNPDEQARVCLALSQRVDGGEAELRDSESQIENLAEQIGRTKSQAARDRYEARMIKLEDHKKSLTADLETTRRDLAKAKAALQSVTNWQKGLADLKAQLETGDPEIRARTRAHLRELIDRIKVFAVGGQRVSPVVVDCTEDDKSPGYWLPQMGARTLTRPEWDKFKTAMDARLASKEGRFISVYFKSLPGIPLEFVPNGSIAMGFRLKHPQHVDDPDRAYTGVPGWLELVEAE